MPTVLIATGLMNAGGAETLIMEMLRHRSPAVQYVLLIHHSNREAAGIYDAEIRAMGIPMVRIPSVGSVGQRRYLELFQDTVKSLEHIDILHSHLNAVGGIIAKAARQAGIPHRIIHCHADITYTGNRFRILLNEMKLWIMKHYVRRYGNAFWACSEAAGRRLFPAHAPVKVIPNVIDVRKYLNDKQKRERCKSRFNLTGKFVIGSVGRIAPIQNYELALETTAWLNQNGRETEFVCFGRPMDTDYHQRLQHLAADLEIQQHVHWLGNSANVSEDIALFDVFLMPSTSEGFGMAALEAQAAGLPTLVSTGVPGIIDMKLGLVRRLDFNAQRWGEEILQCRNLPAPPPAQILAAFDREGYNSPTAVKGIEDAYLRMCQLA